MQGEIGSYVVYGVNGVCRIEERKNMVFADKEREYFVLVPVNSKSSKIFVPTDNEALTSKMKKILSADEIRALIRTLPEQGEIWDDSPINRKERFKSILDSGDREQLMALIRTLYEKKKEREAKGKKLWSFEEYALEAAQKNLHEEFALVLNLKRDEVAQFIAGELQEK